MLLLVATGMAFADEAQVTLSGFVIDDSGVPVDGILIHAQSGTGADQMLVSGRTADDGSYALEVPDASRAWLVVTDERELLERGYFCVPGFVWQGGEEVDPGQVLQIPQLTTVPLRPQLSLVRSETGVSCVRLDFDWIDGISPSVLRQFRIERSLDMQTWTQVLTVALGCPPMSVFDETQSAKGAGYYRVVPADPVIVGWLQPEEWQFLGDPAVGGIGFAELVFDVADPLPETPVMAPEIYIRGGE